MGFRFQSELKWKLIELIKTDLFQVVRFIFYMRPLSGQGWPSPVPSYSAVPRLPSRKPYSRLFTNHGTNKDC